MADFEVLLYLSALACFLATLSSAADTFAVSQPLKDGDSIVSADERFELGFFSPGRSSNRYVGIWYKEIATGTVVWVANRDSPLNNTQGELLLNDQGTLLLLNSTRNIVWCSNPSVLGSNNPVAQLLDTGNLVIRNGNDDNPDNFVWQSFDFMGDTFLPGVKLGIDLTTGLNRYVTSWKSFDDPSTGNYSNRLDPNGVPQFYLYEGSVVRFRGGHWNGLRFAGMPNLKPNPIYTYEFVSNEKEIYYRYDLINSSVLSRMAISPDGVFRRFTWVNRAQGWFLYLTANTDNCDRYALCGAHGICDIDNSPACDCLKGFVSKYPQDWAAADWSHGCVRKFPLDCGEGEGFLKYSGIKLPDTHRSWYNKSMDIEECKEMCLKNCSCTAYASLDVRNGGSGCILWFGDLIDIRQYDETGQDLYIRMAASEIEAYDTSEGNKRLRNIVIPVSCVGLSILGLFLVLFLIMRGRKQTRRVTGILPYSPQHEHLSDRAHEDLELPLFDFDIITGATNRFSDENKLGQGGFGTVYKGILEGTQEIAVKRLSKKSRQGIVEFKNEVLCISKLQHRNLVKLLGCCIEQEERLLIYEYMPNKSLDSFIFDQEKSEHLDWQKRLLIINGIARGLLYLHQDSRLRIIHRDLKASNILLDRDLNPKISDFGMARSFGGDETEANTHRVVGTYGYMSPEYAIDGLFSIKSDVFSFGVLVLEIVSGKRNRRFCHPEHKLNLLGHAWKLYNEYRALELVDSVFRSSCDASEVLRTIQIGLLCVQQSPEDRPNMSKIVLMLSSNITLPQPKKPGFFAERTLVDDDSSTTNVEAFSKNGLTVTMVEPR